MRSRLIATITKMPETMKRCRKYSSRTTSGTASSTTSVANSTIGCCAGVSRTPEKTFRTEQQDQDYREKPDRVLPSARQITCAERFRETEQQSTDNGAEEASHATEDHHDERLQRDHPAHGRLDRDESSEHRTRGGGERGTEHEGE